ncbi:YihY/virulence factor BrkB family protein [Pontibacter oryzae]|uniref:YihY/virulence factor BrkB family protein n=1 Tax=Pontibacter oryzae TaxID=2304593 RepID=A0A399S790_9BACT|nr:YihY/virulence factor BrkB family protein [Pontibacter oryzae]RIJ37435.1 YihY/virulence factor BrkB family protein [Pontibacter oryzae]
MANNYTPKEIFGLLKTSGIEFLDNKSLRLAAALAFNAIFSIPPILIILIKVASLFLGEEAVSGELASTISKAIGPNAAEAIQGVIKNASMAESSGWALWVGIGTTIFAATTFFSTLQESLNSVWNLKVKPTNGILQMAKVRMFSFGIILSIALLMLISFVISTGISVLSDFLSDQLPGIGVWVIKLIDFVVSVGLVTLLFGLIFKYLPDAHIRWQDTLIGALITALLFALGKFLISLYIGTSDPGSAYGAAGSIIVLLVWIYYSSMIVFYGAEFTQQYATKYGQRIHPKSHAVFVEEREVHKDPQDKKSGRPPSEGRFEG